jgi:hypothetical protein
LVEYRSNILCGVKMKRRKNMIKNSTDADLLNELVTKVLRKTIGVNHEVIINDWDLDRVYLHIDDIEFDIRMWNVWNGTKINTLRVQWTLLKMIYESNGDGHGEEIGCGVSIVSVDNRKDD